MRKIISSLLIISVAAILIGLGTFAYFSDTETSKGNIASTGTIDISVDWPTPTNNGELSDLKPSQVRYLTETVRNVGKNPAVVYKHTHVNGTSDDPVVDPESKEGTIINADGTSTYVPRSDIDKVILYDLAIGIQRLDGTIETREIIPNPSDGETGPTLAMISSKWIKLGLLKPGEVMYIRQSYHMKKSTTNWAQADSVNFDMDFKAIQENDDTTFRPMQSGDPDFDLLKQSWPPQSFFDVFIEI